MKGLDELLLKWQDQSLSEEELTGLNTLLAQPEARARLLEEFRFDATQAAQAKPQSLRSVIVQLIRKAEKVSIEDIHRSPRKGFDSFF